MPDVVIVGAGLTGLSAAYHLEQQGVRDILICEQEERPGGLLRSHTDQGYTFDYTGHFLHISNPAFRHFIDDCAGLSFFESIERKSAIFMHDVHVPYPIQMHLYGLPAEVIYECVMGYLQRSSRKKKIDSFYDWALFYFGSGFVKHFFDPYNARLLSWPIKKLHAGWTGRFVPQTTVQQVVRGALVPADAAGVGYNSSFLYPQRGGIEVLIKGLLSRITSPVYTATKVVKIDQQKKCVYCADGKSYTYRHLITTAPLDTTVQALTRSPHDAFAGVARQLWCSSLININIGYARQTAQPYHWVYFPQPTYAFYRLGVWNNISKHLAPAGTSSAYVELSYQPRKTKRSAMQGACEQAILQATSYLGLAAQDIVSQVTLELPHAYVTYTPWRARHLAGVLNALKEHDIYSVGRFGEWKYSSMQEAFEDGCAVAADIVARQKGGH